MRAALRRVTAAAAIPYGYTLTTWGSGAVAITCLGFPRVGDVLLFICGAVVAFVALELAAHGGLHARPEGPPSSAIWTHAHLLSAGGAVLLTRAAIELPLRSGRWAVAGAVATLAYLLAIAALTVLTDRRL